MASYSGGGIHCWNSSSKATNNIISGNTVITGSGSRFCQDQHISLNIKQYHC